MEQPNALAVALGLCAMRPAASENEPTDALHPRVERRLLEARADAVDQTLDGAQDRAERAQAACGRARARPPWPDTSAITKRPSRNHSGESPTVNARMAKPDEHDGGKARVHRDLHEQGRARRLAPAIDAAPARIVHHQRRARQVERGGDGVHEERAEHERQASSARPCARRRLRTRRSTRSSARSIFPAACTRRRRAGWLHPSSWSPPARPTGRRAAAPPPAR